MLSHSLSATSRQSNTSQRDTVTNTDSPLSPFESRDQLENELRRIETTISSKDKTRTYSITSRQGENDFIVEESSGPGLNKGQEGEASGDENDLTRQISRLSSPKSRSRTLENGEARQPKLQRRPSQTVIDTERPGPTILFVSTSSLRVFLEQAALFSLLTFASIWGVLTRLGLTAIGTYDGRSVFPLLWAQMFGCLIMGIASARKEEIVRIDSLLHTMITTGYCGSVTTFSSWMVQVFEAFGNEPGYNRHGWHDFVDGLAQTILTLGMCTTAVHLGLLISSLLPPLPTPNRTPTEKYQTTPPNSPSKTLLHLLFTFLGMIFWIGAILLCALKTSWRGKLSMAIIFGPLGTYARFQLSKINPKFPAFPFGTFIANILATALLSTFTLLQLSSSTQHAAVGCEVLQGLMDGFCGCLSTISTFAVEVRTLKGWKSVRYAGASWVAGQVVTVLVLGSYWWSKGLEGKCKFEIR